MIVEIGLILTIISIGLVILAAIKPRPLIIPILALIFDILGVAGLIQDVGISSDNWAFTIVIILGASIFMIVLGQIFDNRQYQV